MLVHSKDKIQDAENVGAIQSQIHVLMWIVIKSTQEELDGDQKQESKNTKRTWIYMHHKEYTSTRSARIASNEDIHKSTITDYVVDLNHVAGWQVITILAREGRTTHRQVREAICSGGHYVGLLRFFTPS